MARRVFAVSERRAAIHTSGISPHRAALVAQAQRRPAATAAQAEAEVKAGTARLESVDKATMAATEARHQAAEAEVLARSAGMHPATLAATAEQDRPMTTRELLSPSDRAAAAEVQLLAELVAPTQATAEPMPTARQLLRLIEDAVAVALVEYSPVERDRQESAESDS